MTGQALTFASADTGDNSKRNVQRLNHDEDTGPEKIMQRLTTDQLAKNYRGRQVVRGVCLEIHKGEVVGLLGPNGAGKTTTFYMIVGLVQPDSGRVLVGDHDITRLPMYLRARNFGISYLPQEPSIFRKLTVEENILAVLEVQPGGWEQRRTRTERLIEQLSLGHVTKDRAAMRFPAGNDGRVEIARCLCIEPNFILAGRTFFRNRSDCRP